MPVNFPDLASTNEHLIVLDKTTIHVQYITTKLIKSLMIPLVIRSDDGQSTYP